MSTKELLLPAYPRIAGRVGSARSAQGRCWSGWSSVSFILRELVEARFGPVGPLADLSAVAVPMAATAWLAPYASYRRRDALLWLVGPGIYVFAVIAWRVALAPYRDWQPSPGGKGPDALVTRPGTRRDVVPDRARE